METVAAFADGGLVQRPEASAFHAIAWGFIPPIVLVAHADALVWLGPIANVFEGSIPPDGREAFHPTPKANQEALGL